MNFKRKILAGCFAIIAVLIFGNLTYAQMVLSQPNTPVVENFSSMGNAQAATVPSGWRIDNIGSSTNPANPNGTNPTYANSQTTTTQQGTGSGNTGGAYNFADGTNAADRALGILVSGTSFLGPRNIFVQLRNDTGQTITSLDVSFNYEKYRTGQRTTVMSFFASTNGTMWSQAFADGSQTFPGDTTNTLISPPAQTPKSLNLPNVNIPAGAVFYLRWQYTESGANNRQGVGIDDVSVTARTAGGGGNTPQIAVTPTSIDFGAVAVGTTSPERTYSVTGTNLTDNIAVAAPPEFLVSTDGGDTYAQTGTLPAAGGTITAILKPTSTGPKSGQITNTSNGAQTQNVAVTGTASQSFTVNGQIAYKGSQPLGGILVNAYQNGTISSSAVSDINGNYAITLPGGGTYSLSVATAPFAFAVPEQTVANLSGNQTVSFNAVAATVLISEFRFHGTNSADEFVEIYNSNDTAKDISGFALVTPDSSTPKYIAPGDPNSRTTVIPARGHFLITGAGYSLNAYAAGDGLLNSDIPDGVGVGLFTNIANVSPSGRIDAVGFAGTSPLFAEGSPLNPPGGITTDGEISFFRNYGSNGFAADTDNNSADFSFVSTNAAVYNGLQSIQGAPGPENRQSPVFNPANTISSVFDSGAGVGAAPNRTTDPAATNNGLSPLGTVSTRSTFTNRAPLPITQFRLRITKLSTVGSPLQYNPQAIVRLLSSANINVTKSDGSVVPVLGTLVQSPPNQPLAGGLNSSLLVSLSGPINVGESINVDTTMGFIQSGRTIFNTVVETTLAAPQSTSEHLTLGNPSNATPDPVNQPNNYLLQKAQWVASYSRDRAIPNWVSWHLDSSWLGSTPRQDNFRPDDTLPAGWYQVQANSYSGSGFDRGHNCPSADRTDSVPDNSATFLMSNMMPQAPDNNQGPWEQLESYARTLVGAGNELYIIAGSYGNGGTGNNGGVTNSLQGGKIAVPAYTFKVIVVLPVGDNDAARVSENTRVIGIIMPNTQGIRNNDWRTYRVSVNQIEQATGLNFLSNVSPAVNAVIKARVDNQ